MSMVAPPPAPMASATGGAIAWAHAETATRPARTPWMAGVASDTRSVIHDAPSAVTPPAAPATRALRMRIDGAISSCRLPESQPNQPSHRMKSPTVARGMLAPGMRTGKPRRV